ncbi:DUF3329 domain-containing protein [Mycolicibacillus koreensis]|uniref:DUF3329 domain-containing protein n=1 Tax=Mycolicibacillus koreensis TaxID=1069220 RepID=UPI00138BBE1D|nr:DUF3329 domain-containing protein [Mycolicibacillus koreensis]BBY54953.1 hypothetical protein MKOR_22040 [Mycolicibacillus koreensis]
MFNTHLLEELEEIAKEFEETLDSGDRSDGVSSDADGVSNGADGASNGAGASNEAEDAATDESSDTDEPPRRPPSRRMWVAVAVLAALVVALGAATGYLGWQYRNDRAVHAAAAAALEAANEYAVALTSIDSDDLDANFQAVLDGATGQFRDIYSASSTKLRKLLVDHRASGHGVVIDSAVKSASTSEVVVLLFVDQTISNTEVPDPRVDRSRIVMTMQPVDGTWKAAEVELP